MKAIGGSKDMPANFFKSEITLCDKFNLKMHLNVLYEHMTALLEYLDIQSIGVKFHLKIKMERALVLLLPFLLLCLYMV